MGYYVINKHPVFLFGPRLHQISEEALKDKSSLWEMGALTTGRKEAKEAEELIYKTLKAKHDKDPELFYSEWVRFDISGKEASQSAWTLLYDYCCYYGYAYLSDLRDFVDKLIDEYEGDSYSYPRGYVFTLNHFVKPARWWWKYIYKMTGRTIRLIIVTENIYRLVGNMADFTIFSKDFRLKCSQNLEIFSIINNDIVLTKRV